MARSFNGTSDRLNVVDAASLDLRNVTVAYWAYFDQFDTDRNQVSKRNNAASTVNYAVNHNATNMQVFYTDTPGVFRILNTTLSGNFATGQWYHIAAVFAANGADTDLSLYKNGTLLTGPTTFTGDQDQNNADLSIGHNESVEFHDGNLADVGVWNVALTANEIAMLRFVGPGRVRPMALVGFWRLGVGSPEPDWSGNGNNATVTGTAIVDHVPSGPPFGFDPEWGGAFTAAVAAGWGPILGQQRNRLVELGW